MTDRDVKPHEITSDSRTAFEQWLYNVGFNLIDSSGHYHYWKSDLNELWEAWQAALAWADSGPPQDRSCPGCGTPEGSVHGTERPAVTTSGGVEGHADDPNVEAVTRPEGAITDTPPYRDAREGLPRGAKSDDPKLEPRLAGLTISADYLAARLREPETQKDYRLSLAAAALDALRDELARLKRELDQKRDAHIAQQQTIERVTQERDAESVSRERFARDNDALRNENALLRQEVANLRSAVDYWRAGREASPS